MRIPKDMVPVVIERACDDFDGGTDYVKTRGYRVKGCKQWAVANVQHLFNEWRLLHIPTGLACGGGKRLAPAWDVLRKIAKVRCKAKYTRRMKKMPPAWATAYKPFAKMWEEAK